MLGEEGKKQFLFVFEKRKDGKIPTNLSESDFKEVLKAEITIIEKLNNDLDMEEICKGVKALLIADKKASCKKRKNKK